MDVFQKYRWWLVPTIQSNTLLPVFGIRIWINLDLWIRIRIRSRIHIRHLVGQISPKCKKEEFGTVLRSWRFLQEHERNF
jgi:hypothetical protein